MPTRFGQLTSASYDPFVAAVIKEQVCLNGRIMDGCNGIDVDRL